MIDIVGVALVLLGVVTPFGFGVAHAILHRSKPIRYIHDGVAVHYLDKRTMECTSYVNGESEDFYVVIDGWGKVFVSKKSGGIVESPTDCPFAIRALMEARKRFQ